jgi:hypothetical protein
MLINDSVTVAVEVPIILTPDDIVHMQRELGFEIPIECDLTHSFATAGSIGLPKILQFRALFDTKEE